MKIPGLQKKHGRYWLVRRRKWIRLSRIDEGLPALYRALASVDEFTPTTLSELFPLYLDDAAKVLKPPTLRAYTRVLVGTGARPGIIAHRFGHMLPDDVEVADIGEFLQWRADAGRGTSGNRERAALSSFYEWAIRRRYAKQNPCRGVRRNRETPSDRIVSDDELLAGMNKAPPHYAVYLGFKYISGWRMTDIIRLERFQLKDDGIHYTESKTGKRNVMLWTPATRQLVQLAIDHADAWRARKRFMHNRVFTNARGQPWTVWALMSAKARLGVEWSGRDLRSKAATDADHDVIGHRGQMLNRYQKARRLRPVR